MEEKVAQEVLRWLESSRKFVVSEAPELARQTLSYRTSLHTFWLITGLVGLVVLGIVAWRFYEEIRAKENVEEFTTAMFSINLICSIIAAIIALINGIKLLKIILAPKLYLISFFSDFIS